MDLQIAETRRLYAYWRSRQSSPDRVPERGLFDPADIKDILSLILLIHRESPESLRLKIMGTRVVERMGRDLTGIEFLDVFGPEGREERRAVFNAVLDRPAMLVFDSRIRVRSGAVIPSEGLFLPLAVDGRPSQIVGLVGRVNSLRDRQPSGDTIVDVNDVERFELIDLAPAPEPDTTTPAPA